MKRSVSRALFSILVVCAAIAATAGFSSCDVFNYSDPVDSRLYSDNLISSIGFDQFVGSDTSLARSSASPATGKWDFAYCYDSWSDKFAYMTFAPVTDSGYTTAGSLSATCQESLPSGLTSGAPVYRLSLVNLISNGDFESGTLTDSGTWTKSKVSSNISANLSTASPVNGAYSVAITVESRESITFTPTTATGYGFNKDLAYSLKFRYSGTNDGTINDNDATNSYAQETSAYDSWKYYKGDYSPLANGAAPYLAFKAPSSGGSIEGFSVDDFMLKRKDGMTLRLRLQPNQTSTTMIEGRYQFSVWVHADPLASSSVNPFPVDTFTVTMKNVVNGYNAASSTATYKRSMTGWQKLTVLHNTSALQFTNRTDQTLAVIEIDIDCNSSLPGRVLLAAPDFRMVSE